MRGKVAGFLPPRTSRPLIGAFRWALPAILRSQELTTVECAAEDLERLRALAGERVAIFPNHPTALDSAILFHLSGRVDQTFHFVAAREVFDYAGGAWGWLIQRLGTYSILRGTPDRAAFKMTRELLGRPGMKLVIFPEGETYSQNDSLLPFHNGITQLLFWVQEDLARAGGGESVYVLPVAVKYRFIGDVGPALLRSLARLEAALGLTEDSRDPGPLAAASPDVPAGDLYPRIRRIGASVVARLEQEYGLVPDRGASLAQRMLCLKGAIVDRVAGALHVQPRGKTLPDRMRFLVNSLYQVTDEEPEAASSYDQRLWDDRRERVRPLMADLDRLANWIAVYDGYVAARPSVERMADLLVRLEIEVLGPPPPGVPGGWTRGKRRLVGKRRGLLRIGTPFSLAEHYSEYKTDKRGKVAELTRRFESEVQSLLDSMA
jgi:hypothetical protein